MKKSAGPVKKFPLAAAAAAVFSEQQAAAQLPDFSDTEKTFLHQRDSDLRRSARLFQLMRRPWLTRLLSTAGLYAVRWGIPGATWGVKHTIYRQFVGGTSLTAALPSIERLYTRKVTSILDYGAEAKDSEADYNSYMKEVLRALAFSTDAPAAIATVVKLTALAPESLLAVQHSLPSDALAPATEDEKLGIVLRRLDAICGKAHQLGRQLYIDAEESWLQDTIDQLATRMMERYNKERVVVLNTYQMYRHDRLARLMADHDKAVRRGYFLGVKLVRGAYMIKENERASRQGYPSPIQPSLAATHADYDAAARFCLTHIDRICLCLGTHNEASIQQVLTQMHAKGLPRNHPHIYFAQLLGMSDNITFNLAEGGYNASKYMVYGPVKEVLPYLVRRAEENTSVTGEVGRELALIQQERQRRK